MVVSLKENKAALLKVKERFINNSQGFYEKYRFWILMLMITALLDAFSTFCFMYVIGPKYELHPIVRELSYLMGPLVGPFVGGFLKISLGICAIIYLRRFEKQLLVLACILYSYAFMHNLRVTGIFNLL
jgi:hypothetical protein